MPTVYPEEYKKLRFFFLLYSRFYGMGFIAYIDGEQHWRERSLSMIN